VIKKLLSKIANMESTEECKGNWIKASVTPGENYTDQGEKWFQQDGRVEVTSPITDRKPHPRLTSRC